MGKNLNSVIDYVVFHHSIFHYSISPAIIYYKKWINGQYTICEMLSFL